MPTNTFFNLPKDKKERVIDAAVDEFSKYSYHKASVTKIIKKAGIASGSFYQYFEDKKDLYSYVIQLFGKKKLNYMSHILEKIEDLNFFELLREIYFSGIKFAKENPELEAIGVKLINEENLYKEMVIGQKPDAVKFTKGLLKKGIAKGDIDPAIDINIVAHLLTTLNFSLAELIYEDGELNKNDMLIIDKVLYVIENGIKNNKI